MQAINYGIIGCGMMGREHLRNLALIEGSHVSAIVEPDADMRAASARLVPQAEFKEDIAALLAEAALDALIIASPNHLHVDQLEQIAAIRPLPLLLEKPVLTDREDIARLQTIAKGYDAPIWVAMEYRYMPAIAEFIATQAVATGGPQMLSITEHRFPFLEKVGDWNRFNANSGGTFVEKCCHFFDLMRLIAQAEPLYVMAIGGQAVNHLQEQYEGRTPDIWDHGYVLVEFTNGCRACLELSMFAEGAPYQEVISAVGHKGKIECGLPGPGRFWSPAKGAQPKSQISLYPRDSNSPTISREIPVDAALLDAGDHNGSTFYQHQKFANMVRGNGVVEVTLEDGIKAAAMGLAAQISVLEKRAVYLDELF